MAYMLLCRTEDDFTCRIAFSFTHRVYEILYYVSLNILGSKTEKCTRAEYEYEVHVDLLRRTVEEGREIKTRFRSPDWRGP